MPSLPQWSYRDAEAALRARRDELLARRLQETAEVAGPAHYVYGERLARSAAGLCAILFLVSAPLMVLCRWLLSDLAPGDHGSGWLTGVLLCAPLAGAISYLAARALSRRSLRRALRASLYFTADVHADLARLEAWSADQKARELATGHEARSVALPLCALSLMMPLLLHFLVYTLLAQPTGMRGLCNEFSFWIMASYAIVGHSHLVLAFLCWRFSQRLRTTATQDLASTHSGDGFAAWGLTVVSSTIPGLVMYAIPVILVALTGLLFIPAMFSFTIATIRRERLLLVP